MYILLNMKDIKGLFFSGRPDHFIGLPLIFYFNSSPENYKYCILSIFGIIAGNSLNNYVDYENDIKQTKLGKRKYYYHEKYCKKHHYLLAYKISSIIYLFGTLISNPYNYKTIFCILHYITVLLYNIKVKQYNLIKNIYTANYFAMYFLIFDISKMEYLFLLLYFFRTETLFENYERENKNIKLNYFCLSIIIQYLHLKKFDIVCILNLIFLLFFYHQKKINTNVYKLQLISYLIILSHERYARMNIICN